MITLGLSLAWAGDAEELALWRARADLDAGRTVAARDGALPLLNGDAPVEVWEVWLGAMAQAGLEEPAADELAQLALVDPHAAVANAVRRVRRGQAPPGSVAVLAGTAPEDVPVAMAMLALDVNAGPAAVEALVGADGPAAARWRIAALRVADRDRDAITAVEDAKARWPDHPELWVGLWATPRASGSVARLQKKLVAEVAAGVAAEDALGAWRARELAIAAGDTALAVAVGERLVALGERPPLPRRAWSERVCREIGRAQAERLQPAVPPGSFQEQRWIVEALADGLEAVERRPDAIAQVQQVRQAHEDPALARRIARMYLQVGKVGQAADHAIAAVKAAARAGEGDLGRSHLAEQRRDLAEGLALWAAALVGDGREGQALEVASLAAAVDPSGRWDELRQRLVGRGAAPMPPADALARAEAALAAGQLEVARREASTAIARVAYRSPDAFRGPDTASAIAQALDISARTRGPDDRDGALVDAVMASLIAPTAERFEARGRAYQALGMPEAAFVSFAEAIELGAAPPADLGAGWRSLVPPPMAADFIADHVDPTVPEAAVAGPSVRAPREGQPLPAFTVATTAGDLTSDGLRGQYVILTFFASWCGPCRQELPALDALVGRLRADGVPVTLLAVSVDDQRDAYEAFKRGSTNKVTVWAWSPELGRTFRARALPTMWLVGPDGVAILQHVGYSPDVLGTVERHLRGGK